MTKEELEKEAEEKAKKLEESQTIGIYDNNEDYEYDNGWNKGEIAGFKEDYLAGAEPREKRIEELEAQIEKMKEIGSEMYVLICDKCESRNCAFCSVKEKWQMFKE